ncbi:efflux RND transporter permease subunit, partial [candidate division KSB1 bacterium]|nr:efflux RND transporter permease subunit [candidate division KSB1 bacterium]
GISVELPPGSNFDQTNKALFSIEKELEDVQEIESYYTILGQAPGTFIGNNEGIQFGQIVVKLISRDLRTASTNDVLELLKRKLTRIPMADITVKKRESAGGGDDGNPLQIEISGENLDRLNLIADEIMKIAKSTPGAVDIRSSWREGVPELHLVPNRKKLADYGISLSSLAAVIRTSIEGNVATQYRVGNKEYDIRVQLSKKYVKFADQVMDIIIKKDDMFIPLSELATLRQVEGPTSISRKNKKRLITVSGNFANRSGGDVVADISAGIDNLDIPPGYLVHFGGDAEFQ